MTGKICFRFLIAALISVTMGSSALATSRIIALGGEANGQILALDDVGVLWALRTDAKSFREARQIGQLPTSLSPIDLAAFSTAGASYAAITGAIRGGGPFPGMLCIFDIARGGKPQEISLGLGAFTGLAYDQSRNRVLIAEARQMGIFEAAPIPSRGPRVRNVVETITAMKVIGPVALDTIAQRLYCADPVVGAVYVVDLASGKQSLVLGRLGEIRALCLDIRNARLYVGDCARRRVWVINLNPSASVAPFAAGVKFREPDGIAIDAAGNVWIADEGTGAISVRTSTSELLKTLTR